MIATFVRFRHFVRPYAPALAAGVVLAGVHAALGLAQPWPLKVVVDEVLAPAADSGAPASGLHEVLGVELAPRALLALAVLALLTLVGLAALADYWSTRLMQGAGQRVGNDVRERLFQHLQRLSLRYHGRTRVGDLATRLTSDVDRVQDLLVQALSVLVPNALLVAGMLVVMLSVDPGFTLVAMAASPFMAVAVYRSGLEVKAASRRARRYGGEVAAEATETLAAIHVVQAFTLEDHSAARFAELNRASLGASLDAVRLHARFGPVVDITAAVSTATVLWFGANRVLAGRLSIGTMLVFLSYLSSLYKPVRALSKLGWTIARGTACGERIEAVLAEEPDVRDRAGARIARRLRGAVALRGVEFSYDREPVLRGIDLAVEPGETLALVGPTGAGKSTIAGLVPRFYDPRAGAVLVDGVDVRDYRLDSLRSHISLVLQDTVLFRGSLWDNIACGRRDATDEEVAEAARLALVDEFAERLPFGLHTVVGERGVDLSGGQRQRIAIARAIARDAPIVILDEPTSALDAVAEELVMKALANLTRDRTVLVIAHRLSTVRAASRVAVLEAGRIVEQGSHRELVVAGGRYATLCRLQNGVIDGAGPQQVLRA